MSEYPVELQPLLLMVEYKPMESFEATIYAVYMVEDIENPPPGIPGYEYGNDFVPDYTQPTPDIDHYELWAAVDPDSGEAQIYAFGSPEDAMEYVYELSQIIWEQGKLPLFSN